MIAPLGIQRIRPGADGLADGEELELLAEHAVVAVLGFLELLEVGVEFLLVEERGAVEPLELLARSESPFQYAPATESSLNACRCGRCSGCAGRGRGR